MNCRSIFVYKGMVTKSESLSAFKVREFRKQFRFKIIA